MWISKLTLENFRSYEQAELNFSSRINVLIGANNAGKSSILLPLLGLQEGLPHPTSRDARIGATKSQVNITFGNIDESAWEGSFERVWYEYRPKHTDYIMQGKPKNSNQSSGVAKLPNREPKNFIYPFISKRKVTQLGEQVIDQTVESVPSTFENLNAKIDRIMNPEFLPAHSMYMKACDDILGFRVTTAHTGQGKRAVYTVENMRNIPLLAMGEGVMNILGLVVHLAISSKKLFLIEEPENDVHPKALKALLDLIIEKSTDNQFIITTHSNIVLKKLGSVTQAKVFAISSTLKDRLPTSIVSEVESTPDARRSALAELGYELYDADLWSAWLFLEESSAEKLVREYFIPWYCPELVGRLRTFSAHSVTEVSPKFKDFNELFVYLHLEPLYKNRAWVVIDAGVDEAEVIKELRATYTSSGWKESQFTQLSKHDFEDYYPSRFGGEVSRIKGIQNKSDRRIAKKRLLDAVELWIHDNSAQAKHEFSESAVEVINIIKNISSSLRKMPT